MKSDIHGRHLKRVSSRPEAGRAGLEIRIMVCVSETKMLYVKMECVYCCARYAEKRESWTPSVSVVIRTCKGNRWWIQKTGENQAPSEGKTHKIVVNWCHQLLISLFLLWFLGQQRTIRSHLPVHVHFLLTLKKVTKWKL